MNFWEGERIRLRAFEPEDGDTIYEWDHDSEMARALDYVWPPNSRTRARRWAEEQSARTPQDDQYIWAIETRAGKLVGIISTHSCNRRAGTFGYGVAIRREHRGHGYAAEAIWIVLRYFFDELRYQKATVGVYAGNEASIRLHERLGFVLEGRLRRMAYTRGAYQDELLYGLTAEEFRAAEEAHRGGI